MKIYWQETKIGQRLVLAQDPDIEEEIGGVRKTKNGFDAFAKTLGYEPGRAEKGIDSMEQAKDFVESFKPWELYAEGTGLTVEPETKSMDC